MATQFEIDCALMAGRAYQVNRSDINQFPIPSGWAEFFHVPNPGFQTTSGFEAVSFQRDNEIIIAYTGSDPSDISGDIAADAGLATGMGSAQLLQAADYYLAVKAANPGANITFTGHSLGGGLAALMGVLFDQRAVTFDQAPFRLSANNDTRTAIRNYLNAQITNEQPLLSQSLAAVLDGFWSSQAANGEGESDTTGIGGTQRGQSHLTF